MQFLGISRRLLGLCFSVAMRLPGCSGGCQGVAMQLVHIVFSPCYYEVATKLTGNVLTTLANIVAKATLTKT